MKTTGPTPRVSPRSRFSTLGASARAGAGITTSILSGDHVDALAVPPLSRLDRAAHLLAQGAADESAHAVGLPTSGFHDLGQGRAALPFQQANYGGGLAAVARYRRRRGLLFLALGRALGGAGLLARLRFRGRALRRRCATLSLSFRFRLLRLAQFLDALPDLARGGLGVLESLRRRHAWQAVPDCHQPVRRPSGDQLPEFLLAGEGIDRGCRRSGRNFLLGGECAD